ncbi:MAG: tetratricopeptide repeat protein [Candidatus Rifleibacteriota bacterium]
MGEDVMHPSGLVLTVNEMSRKPFTAGLGGHGKQDEIRLNLTMVNTGIITFRVNPVQDLTLELSKTYELADDPEKKASRQDFNVFPSNQSRLDLYFKVSADDELDPILIFKLKDASVKIICSNKFSKLVEKNNSNSLSTSEAIELAGFYVDYGRYDEAEDLLNNASRYSAANNELWMLLAAVYQQQYKNEAAADCLARVNPTAINNYDEAASLAAQAVKLGQYQLAIDVLEPYEQVNRLMPETRVVLARAYYYQDEYAKAERILNQMERKGSNDPKVYFTLGNLKDKQKKNNEAIEYWEKTLDYDPDYSEACYNLGVGYYKLDRIDKARKFWKKVLLLNPDSSILRATEDALNATDY